MDKKEMRNLFDGDCSPAEEQIAGRWLAEHAETKEADELLYVPMIPAGGTVDDLVTE